MEKILEFIGNALGATSGEVADALKDGEEPRSEDDIKSYFDTLIKSKISGTHDSGHGRGKKETLTLLERTLKSKYGVSGSDVESIVEAAIEKEVGSVEIDPKDVRNSEVYKGDIQKLKDLVKEKDEAIQSVQNRVKQDKIDQMLRSNILQVLKEGEYDLPDEGSPRRKRIDLFVSDFKDRISVDLSEGDALVYRDGEGNELKNEYHEAKSLRDLVLSDADIFFDKAKRNPQTPGARNRKPEGAGSEPAPKVIGGVAIEDISRDNYYEILATPSLSAEEKALLRQIKEDKQSQGDW